MVGMRSRWGEHVNAIAFLCAPIKIPEKPFADTKTIGMIFCHGSGGMQIVPGPTKLTQGITFRAAPQSSQAAIPEKGECAWSDRPIGANEPKKMVALITTDTKPIFDIVGQGGIFLVSVGIEGDSFRVTKVESANVGFEPGCPAGQMRFNGKCVDQLPVVPGTSAGTGGGFVQMFPTCPSGQESSPDKKSCVASQSAGAGLAPQMGAGVVAAPGAPAAGGATVGTCGLSGAATVTIADPALTTLNVRDQPDGTVLTTIPENVPVSVVGACGATIAAGIAAPKVIPGWCAISAPVTGCVKEEFLTAGMPVQGGVPPGSAGIVANRPAQQQQPAPQPQMQVPPVVTAPGAAVVGGGQMAQLTQGANVRNEPSGKAKDKNGNNNVLGLLPGGATVTVLDCNNSWCRISHPQYPSGWVSRKFIQMTGVAVTVQITTPPPVVVVAPEAPPAPAMPQGDGGGLTASTCGLSGTATIVIADPKLTTLNVRDKPNGPTILTTLPENAQVNVVGACGKQIAAGIVAGPTGTVVPGWCAISAPVTGCVKEEFLVAGIPAAAPAGAPGAAGLVAAKPSFAGTWAAEAQGYNYTFTLNQAGGTVTGNYTGTDGSSGQLNGNVSGDVLRFGWRQADGVSGSGKFTLSADGSRFDGSYTLGNNPDVAEGSWNGRRQ
jgi:hypothetical protein